MEPGPELVLVDPCCDPRWRDLARGHGGLFESPLWLAAIADAFGIKPEASLILDQTGEPVAGAAVGRVDDCLGLRFSTFPFCDYSDPIGPRADTEVAALLGPWLDQPAPYAIRTARHDLSQHDARLIERGRVAWHEVDLRAEPDELWAGLAGGARQNVRRAEAEGVGIEISSDRAALDGFHAMHVEHRRRKYQMLAQPVEYFDALHQHFGSDLAVLTARHDGEPVAAFVLLRWGDTAYYKLGSSWPGAGPVRASDALLWRSICHARDHWGCTTLDLGLSDIDQAGLIRFKAKYATNAGELVTYRTEGETPPAAPDVRAMINDITQVLTDEAVPATALRSASSRLYRYFC